MAGSATISWLMANTAGANEVQNKSYGSSADSAGHTITLNNTPVSGNLLILCVNADWDIPTAPSGWTLIQKQASNCIGAIYFKVAGASEPKNITVTQSSSSSMAIYVMEFSGMSASPLDTSSFATNQVSPVNSGTTPTTIQANELLIATANFSPDTNTLVTSWSNSFSEKVQIVPSAGTALRLAVSFRIVSATGAYSTAATAVNANTTNAHNGLIATFKIS